MVCDVLRSDYLTTGPKVQEFEQKFAQKVGVKYAVAVANGTAALHVACLAAGLTLGDELITSPMTFAASANCALYCQAKPIFVDSKQNGLIDETKIEEKITAHTKIIIPVHYSGRPCEMETIQALANRYNLILIEDASHALGALYKGHLIGDCYFSDMTIFSFHPVKHIATGEGGMITTNNPELYRRLKIFRSHGITKDLQDLHNDEGPWYYEMQFLGYNYRLTDIQSALGISQLDKLEEFVKRRKEIAKRYYDTFQNNPFFTMLKDDSTGLSSFHLFPILLKDKYVPQRRKIFELMRKNGLWVQVHYIPVPHLPYYRNLGYDVQKYPNSMDFYHREISIPMYPAMTDGEIDKVILIIRNIFQTL